MWTAKSLSDWVDAQAEQSLRWAHTHFVGFVMSWLSLFSCFSDCRAAVSSQFQHQLPAGWLTISRTSSVHSNCWIPLYLESENSKAGTRNQDGCWCAFQQPSCSAWQFHWAGGWRLGSSPTNQDGCWGTGFQQPSSSAWLFHWEEGWTVGPSSRNQGSCWCTGFQWSSCVY